MQAKRNNKYFYNFQHIYVICMYKGWISFLLYRKSHPLQPTNNRKTWTQNVLYVFCIPYGKV